MKKNFNSSLSLGAFPSPGNYQEKGWSSERVPHASGDKRRNICALTPFYSGRALPSKWDDAERWISSPVLGYGVTKCSSQTHFQQPHRRPKSMSGPIVPLSGFESVCGRNFVANSPFSTGVLMPKGIGTHFNGGLIGGHGWSNLGSDCSSPCSQEENLENFNGDENELSRAVSRRDMATQMSPEGSSHSSPRRSSSPPSECPAEHCDFPGKLEIREVQVDKRAVISKISKNESFLMMKTMEDMQDQNFNHTSTASAISSWDVSSELSKVQREEAKIAAWENLQKAKAEAAIRKLEMKLEKKRASSINKILEKLRTAEIKAQKMRSSLPSQHKSNSPKKTLRISLFSRHKSFSSWTGCFSSHVSSH